MKRIVASLLVCVAQQPAPTPPSAVPAGQPTPAVSVAASALVAHLDRYAGSRVSITAQVVQVYGATAFSIAQGNREERSADVLVVAAALTAPVQPGTYVTVMGDVIRFDSGTLATRMRDAAPPLTGDVVDRYRGKAAVVATSVIDDAMTDLARRLPQPMTPDEEAYRKLMKQIGPGYNTLRQAVTASNAADVGAQAAMLRRLFADAVPFWQKQARPDALQWIDDAQKAAAAIEREAGKGNWDAIKGDVPRLQQICGSCHTHYRERLDDGSYRYKKPST